jgi:hypothetical protein
MPKRLLRYFTTDLAARVRWRMRFDRNPVFVTIQDKYAVIDYARARGVESPPLLHVTEDPGTIPFDALPASYIIKANHGCGWNLACIDSRLLLFGNGADCVADSPEGQASRSAAELSRDEAIRICRSWLRKRHVAREWAYQHIHPRIIVQEFLTPRHGTELLDYRFYTFAGVVKAINIGSPSYRRDHLNVFFRPDWTPIEMTRYVEELPPELPPRPECLDEMIAAAERLGRELDFVRVDLYDTTAGVMLGELTIYPQSGMRGTPSGCPRLDQWLGDQWPMSWPRRLAVVAGNSADLVPDAIRSLRTRRSRFDEFTASA